MAALSGVAFLVAFPVKFPGAVADSDFTSMSAPFELVGSAAAPFVAIAVRNAAVLCW